MQNILNSINSANLKGKTIAIALILLLTMSSALSILPTIKAQAYSYTPTVGSNGLLNIPTFPGITASPDPVGVGQTVQVIMIIELLPPSVGRECSTVVYGGWPGYELSITDPNGTVTTQGPYESDVSGTYQVAFTPDKIGTYSFQFTFPGYTNNNGTRFGQASYGNYSANFLASTSQIVSLTVQQAPVTGYSEAPVPLPTQYWTQPINAQNRYWNSISGPWLMGTYNSTGPFNPYTYAPMSAHILWTQLNNVVSEGLIGGQYGSLSWGGTSGVSGTGYPEIGLNSRSTEIIMGGYLYYNDKVKVQEGLDAQTVAGTGYTTGQNLTNYVVSQMSCLNLQTGQIQWTAPGSFNYAQILNWRTQQQRMCMGYLWSIAAGAYKMYDAVNGQLLVQWFNQPAGTTVFGTGVNATISPKVKLPSAISVLSGTVVNQNPVPDLVGQLVAGATGGGTLLVYLTGTSSVTNSSWIACWNSTLAINSYNGDVQVWNLLSSGLYPLPTSTSANGPSYFPSITDQLNTPLNWENGIMWNYTIPAMYTVNANGAKALGTASIVGVDDKYIILSRGKSNARATGTENYEMEGFPLTSFAMKTNADLTYAANLCNQLPQTPAAFWNAAATPAWVTDIPIPAYDQTYTGVAFLRGGGNLVYPDTTLLSVYDYSESTGQLLWSIQPFQNDFSMQSVSSGTVAYGMLYMNGYDGYMHAINLTTGLMQWVSVTALGGLEIPEQAYPAAGTIVAGPNIQSGLVFCSSSKSYETIPLYRGHSLWAFNATTGAQVWNISGEFSSGTIEVADGILIGFNTYDGSEYAFGSGPTATTVAAPMTPVTAGTSMIIQGTVTDQTPTSQAMGTPAISDTWMTPWMEYLYMDQPMPTSATGVPVSVDAVDPNGNFIHIGTATSDITGSYSYQWTTPDIPGKYTIVATFSADNSYYGSSAETAAVVASSAAAPASPTPTPTSVADMYFVPAIAGIFVLIIVVAIVLALLMLRKHP